MRNLLIVLLIMMVACSAFGQTAYRYGETVSNSRGDVIGGATVTVYLANTTTKATLYSSPIVALGSTTNPVYTDTFGRFIFYTEPGLYDVVVSGYGITSYTTEDIRVWASTEYEYNVEDYGAIPDDGIDDTAAIQSAIDAAEATTGTVKFNQGRYMVATGLVINDDGVSIVGAGTGATRVGWFDGGALLGGTNGYDIFTVTGDSISFMDITLTNGPAIDVGDVEDPPAGSGSIMYAQGSDKLFLSNVNFEECGGLQGLGCRSVTDLTVDNCTFSNITKAGMYVFEACDDIIVTNSTFRDVIGDNPGRSRYLFATGFSGSFADSSSHTHFVRGLTVDGCTFDNNPSWEGLDSHGGEDIRLTNNKIKDCRIGISVTNAITGGGLQAVGDPALKRVLISGNTIERGAATTSLYGITISGNSLGSTANRFYTEDIIVSNNSIVGFGGTADAHSGAIRLRHIDGIDIHNNIIEDFAQYGLYIYTDVYNVSFTENTIRNAGTTHHSDTTVSAIAISGGGPISIRNNKFINESDNIDYWFYASASTDDVVSAEGNQFFHTGSVEPTFINGGDSVGWFGGAFNIKDFGASGTIADNAPYIQSAVDAVELIGSGDIYFPAGSYPHSGVTITDIDVVITGPGAPIDIVGGGPRQVKGTGTPEGVVTAPTGTSYQRSDGGSGTSIYIKESGTGNTGWQAMSSTSQILSQPWALVTQSSGDLYIGGFFIDASGSNDFNPVVNFGTANKAYSAHIYFIAAAGATDTEITVTGTSTVDDGVLVPGDSEVVLLTDAALNSKYETHKKWVGQVAITKTAGTDRLCNYGFNAYWDNQNTNFTIVGGEALWHAGKTDTTFDILIYHHKAAGWTYNAGSTATPPVPIFQLSDATTGLGAFHETLAATPGKWKKTNLSIPVEGNDSEGIIIKVITGTTNVIDSGTITMHFISEQ